MDNQSSFSSSSSPSKLQQPTNLSSLNYYHLSPSRTIYSDRFIPCPSASNFSLFDISPSLSSPPVDASCDEDNPSSPAAYTALLQTTLFGADLGFSLCPIRRVLRLLLLPLAKITFWFKSETRQSL
ncbi:hypothetical protein L6452_32419 [Arctium lappa]|uniref:Uncharacterized protein n=1 Tax=Arctium lappa TaxID=4217 RepID=A0ACB8Z4J8_ARCLA|nr:hypothetical protein L6452_32419 [Arctium lappa]